MNIWSWVNGLARSGLTATGDDLYHALAGPSDVSSGECVTATSVLGLSTAWACVNLLAGTIASLSRDVFQNQNGIRVPAGDHPLQRILDEPNADQSAIDFWEQINLGIELHGNGYSEIARNARREIVALLPPIPPEMMAVRRTSDGSLRYKFYENGTQRDLPETEILHIRGPGGDPLGGMSTLTHAKNVFGNAQSIERTTGNTFRNAIRTQIAMIAEKPLSSTQMDELEKKVTTKYAGAMNAGRPLLLNHGFKAVPVGFKPEEAQMLESRGFSVEEICRIYGVPPFAVGHTEKVTSFGQGLEQQLLWFQKTALTKRVKKIEQALRKQLMSPQDRQKGFGVRHNFEDFLRADSKARAEFYKAMLETKVYTINEVRALEGKPPVKWGDAPFIQLQDRQFGDPPPEDKTNDPAQAA
jgi:HK97 family phage portal protein